MNSGRYILSQVLDLVDRKTLFRLVERYNAESRVRHFGCRQQLICMAFAQLTWREGLRDIETCLNAHPEALYHLGFREPIAKSTLADANRVRDWRLWEELAKGLIGKARRLYAQEDLGLDLENTVYALDSTTIDLSLTLFPWASFRKTKAGVKLHTQLDLRGPIPTCIHITEARSADVLWLDELSIESGAFYIMDRAYVDFERLWRMATAGAFFVTRSKTGIRFSRQSSRPVDYSTGVESDQICKPASKKARAAYPGLVRKIRFYDKQTHKTLIFLTNNMEVPADSVAKLYKMRWQIELFFRWIKSHLRIKHYFGTTANAVKTQVWISVCVYLMIAIHHKQLNAPGSLYRTLQLLSVHPFEKVSLHELLTKTNSDTLQPLACNQLTLWDL